MVAASQPTLLRLVVKSSVAHTLTYFLMGIIAYRFLNYEDAFTSGALQNYMRPVDSAWVAAGPGLQWIRGTIFALALYPIRDALFGRENGWLLLAWLLTALGILSTFGAAPGSIEGMIYTNYPTSVWSYFEIVPQAFLFPWLLHYWIRHAEQRWLDWLLGAAFFVIVAMSALGVLAGLGLIEAP